MMFIRIPYLREYSFRITGVMMYVHKLCYNDKEGTVEAYIEQAPDSERGFLVCESDFNVTPERRKLVLDRFVAWANRWNIKHTIITIKEQEASYARRRQDTELALSGFF